MLGASVLTWCPAAVAATATQEFDLSGRSTPSRVASYGRILSTAPLGGETEYDGFGAAQASAGDLNGDTRPDVVIGAPGRGNGVVGVFLDPVAGNQKPSTPPASYWIYSPDHTYRAGHFHFFGSSVTGLGDVNGDGLSDFAAGAGHGSAIIVFGSRTVADVDAAALGGRGFRIDGPPERGIAPTAIAGAGDVNGDGRPDVVIGDSAGNGRAWLVYGKADTDPVALASLGRNGVSISASGSTFRNARLGTAVSGIGDVNGDGLADVVVGAPGRAHGGAAYVVYGKRNSDPVDLESLGAAGFSIHAAHPDARTGATVAGIGDANGDGLPDLAVGSPGIESSAPVKNIRGEVTVVFGSREANDVNASHPETSGVVVSGAGPHDQAGSTVGGGADVTGDGRPDLLVSSPGAMRRCELGAAYVIPGTALSRTVKLARLPAGSLLIDGADFGPPALSLAGDLNGDERADLLLDDGVALFAALAPAPTSGDVVAPDVCASVVSRDARAVHRNGTLAVMVTSDEASTVDIFSELRSHTCLAPSPKRCKRNFTSDVNHLLGRPRRLRAQVRAGRTQLLLPLRGRTTDLVSRVISRRRAIEVTLAFAGRDRAGNRVRFDDRPTGQDQVTLIP